MANKISLVFERVIKGKEKIYVKTKNVLDEIENIGCTTRLFPASAKLLLFMFFSNIHAVKEFA